MNYKHFFAALTAAFFLCLGTIAAQKDKNQLSQEEFELLVADNAPQAYELAQQNKLTADQLEFFIGYELGNERNFQYFKPLYETYWQQLTPQDKLNFSRMQFIEEYAYIINTEKPTFQFNRGLNYLIQHQPEYKKAWGDSLFNQFILNYANVDCYQLNLHPYTDEVEPFDSRKQKAEKYLDLIKTNLPDYEPYMRSDVYCRCVYDPKSEQELYYNAVNDFLMAHETQADYFNMHTSDLVRANVDLKYKQLGLKWIDKAIELENDPSNVICKAELLYQLGKKDEARKTLLLSKPQAEKDNSWINAYYHRVEKLVETGK